MDEAVIRRCIRDVVDSNEPLSMETIVSKTKIELTPTYNVIYNILLDMINHNEFVLIRTDDDLQSTIRVKRDLGRN